MIYQPRNIMKKSDWSEFTTMVREDTFACFIDFRKAFNCVNRDLLWHKLEFRYNEGGRFLSALKSLYEKISCSVNINQSFTDWFDVDTGVKQGCILSPTLFACNVHTCRQFN